MTSSRSKGGHVTQGSCLSFVLPGQLATLLPAMRLSSPLCSLAGVREDSRGWRRGFRARGPRTHPRPIAVRRGRARPPAPAPRPQSCQLRAAPAPPGRPASRARDPAPARPAQSSKRVFPLATQGGPRPRPGAEPETPRPPQSGAPASGRCAAAGPGWRAGGAGPPGLLRGDRAGLRTAPW